MQIGPIRCPPCEALPDNCAVSHPIYTRPGCAQCHVCTKFQDDPVCLGCPGCPGCPIDNPCPLHVCALAQCDNPITPKSKDGCPSCSYCPSSNGVGPCQSFQDLECPIYIHCQLYIPTTLPNGCPDCGLCCADPVCPECASDRYDPEPGTCPTCDDCMVEQQCPELECTKKPCFGTWFPVTKPDGCPDCPICIPYHTLN